MTHPRLNSVHLAPPHRDGAQNAAGAVEEEGEEMTMTVACEFVYECVVWVRWSDE